MDFNYIVTIHNKGELLERVLAGISASAGSNARIILVLDGCTDGSEMIARRFALNSGLDTRIILAPDVHEIKSINIGLREAKPGYCVIIQDDVVLQEPGLEEQLVRLHESKNCSLGYISMRLAADVKGTNLLRRLRQVPRWGFSALSQMVYVHNHIGHPGEILDVPKARLGEFQQRMVGIKSPVCLTPALRKCMPFLDEALAPYCYDDVDMSLIALQNGLINGLFPVKFQSDLEWGGTRKDPSFSSDHGQAIVLRNRRFLWGKHARLIMTQRSGK